MPNRPCAIFARHSFAILANSAMENLRATVVRCFPEALRYDLRCGKLVGKWASWMVPEAEANLVPEHWFQEKACRPTR
jgi:hypothetical protein